MGRAERRRAEKEKRKQDKADLKAAEKQLKHDTTLLGDFDTKTALVSTPYMTKVIEARAKQRANWDKNGISYEDLQAEYKRGYKNAIDELTEHYMNFFFAAVGITVHELFGFGETRIWRIFDRMNQVMNEELDSGGIIKRLLDETGVDILLEDIAHKGV